MHEPTTSKTRPRATGEETEHESIGTLDRYRNHELTKHPSSGRTYFSPEVPEETEPVGGNDAVLVDRIIYGHEVRVSSFLPRSLAHEQGSEARGGRPWG